MPSSISDPYRAADEEMRSTPGFRLQVGLDHVAQMRAVLDRNAHELQSHLFLDDFTDVSQKLTEEFVQETVRLLFNYCASLAALIETNRSSIVALAKGVGGEVSRWAEVELKEAVELHFSKSQFYFLKDLRNFMMHYKVPVIQASLSFPGEGAGGDLRHEVVLLADPLLKWARWSQTAKQYIQQSSEPGIAIAPLVSQYQLSVLKFYDWLPQSALSAFRDEISLTQEKWEQVQRLRAASFPAEGSV